MNKKQHHMNKVLLMVALLCVSLQLFAQNVAPDFVVPYQQDEVAVIRMYLPADSLAQMIAEQNDWHEYEAQFIYESALLTDTLYSTGLRLRGNTSLNAFKKSFAINFKYGTGEMWQQLDKINLVAEQNDPSLLRSKLCNDMFRYANVAASRTSFVQLYINDEYRGLYLNQEHIDEEFAKKYFDNSGDGNLYKCTYPADLAYISNNADDYKFANWGTRHYDLKTNEWNDDYTDLAHFIDVLNNTSLSNLQCELPKVMNVEGYLKTAAVDVLCGNWDNYIFNNNNYYLYHNQHTGLFDYIPYDLDNTLGIDWVGVDWSERNVYSWAPASEARPLFKRLMQVPTYKNAFTQYLQQLLNDYFTEQNITDLAQQWQLLIQEAALSDTYRPLDFNFTNEDFLNAITVAYGPPQVAYSIAGYVQARAASAASQLISITPTTTQVQWVASVQPVDVGNTLFNIQAHITGSDAGLCELMLSADNITYTPAINFNDSGLAGDAIAGDHVYTCVQEVPAGQNKLYYQLQCNNGQEYPCVPTFIWCTANNQGVHINEVMSVNATTIADEAGEYADWLELWNGTTSAINLNGKYLTDDLNNWNKYPLPNITLQPGEFKIVWLDNEPEQSTLHATFKLNNSDNTVWLFGMEETQPRIENRFWPCISGTDMSQERIVDGGNTIAYADAPTPNASNTTTEVSNLTAAQLLAYPNPAKDLLYFNTVMNDVKLFDSTGRGVMALSNIKSLDVSALERGLYFVQMNGIIVQPLILQ
jgi:hypothetical protein